MASPGPTPREFNPDLPEPVKRAVLKALAREPENRWSMILMCRVALGSGSGDEGPAREPAPGPATAVRPPVLEATGDERPPRFPDLKPGVQKPMAAGLPAGTARFWAPAVPFFAALLLIAAATLLWRGGADGEGISSDLAEVEHLPAGQSVPGELVEGDLPADSPTPTPAVSARIPLDPFRRPMGRA